MGMVEGDVTSEILGLVAGRSRRRQTNAKSRVSELFSSSSEDEQLGGDDVSSDRTTHLMDEEEQSEDGFGSDLMGDEEDREKLAVMTEVEREAVLYERAQARLAKRERRELEQKMRELEGRPARPIRTLPATVERKRRTLDLLRARRQRRRRGTADDDSDYDEDEEDGEVKDAGKTATKADLDDDWEMMDEETPYESSSTAKANLKRSTKSQLERASELIDLEMANKLLLLRDTIAKWIFHPDFDDLARGLFLRLSIGFKGNEQVYRPVEIKKIVKYHRTYKINNVTTNKAALLKYGRSERTFRLDIISNSPITQQEFDRWLSTMREEHLPVPTMRSAETRIQTWRELEERPLCDTVISAMVAAKRELGSVPRNLVAEKAMLLHLRDEAASAGNVDEVERIDEELTQLAKEAATSQGRNSSDARLEALAELNRRNRRLNTANAAEAARKTCKSSQIDMRLDPFSRRKCAPSNSNTLFETGPTHQVTSENKRDTEEPLDSEEPLDESAATLTILPPKNEHESSSAKHPDNQSDNTPLQPSRGVDLFAAHNVDIEIDL